MAYFNFKGRAFYSSGEGGVWGDPSTLGACLSPEDAMDLSNIDISKYYRP